MPFYTSDKTKTLKVILEYCMLLICGLCVGWLVGLSLSPVLQIILTSIISLLVSIIGIMAGIQPASDSAKIISFKKLQVSINPLPVSLLIIGIAVGATYGLFARTNSFFGEDPQYLKKQLLQSGFSPDSASMYVKDHMLDALWQRKQTSSLANNIIFKEKQNDLNPGSVAGLYSVNSTFCDIIRLKHGQALYALLRSLDDARINNYLSVARDSTSLEALKSLLCQ